VYSTEASPSDTGTIAVTVPAATSANPVQAHRRPIIGRCSAASVMA